MNIGVDFANKPTELVRKVDLKVRLKKLKTTTNKLTISNQARLPAELKHINKRRKRN